MNDSCPQEKLSIGVVAFADRSVLILGDKTSILWLCSLIAKRREACLSDHSSRVELANIQDVRIIPKNKIGGALYKDNFVEWNISLKDSTQFAGKLEALAVADKPGHAYLDASSCTDTIQVVVSKGEYPRTIFLDAPLTA